VQFETKIAVVLRDDLAGWEKLDVTAFLVSGIAGTVPGVVGDPYRDASGHERAMARGVTPAIYTRELFATNHDAAVSVVAAEDIDLVGIALRAERKTVDKIVDRLRFHP
jgi:hypothetical protein